VLAAAIAVAAQAAYVLAGLAATRSMWRAHGGAPWHAAALAAAVAMATTVPGWLVAGPLLVPLQLAAGAAALLAGLWWIELRGRWRRVGDGLVRASGFVA
jgi:hypothetical protein